MDYASEFRYRRPIIYREDVLIAISQSGETADTLAALHLAKQRGCLCLGICNTVGSSVARETSAGVYLHAGPEIGVASTKAFSAQARSPNTHARAHTHTQGRTHTDTRTHCLLATSRITRQRTTRLSLVRRSSHQQH